MVEGVQDEQGVAQGAGDDDTAEAHDLVVDDVEPGGALVAEPEVLRAVSGVKGLHRHREADPVRRGDSRPCIESGS